MAAAQPEPTRGVVLTVNELTWPAWPERLAAAGLNTLALHAWPTASPQPLLNFIASSAGQSFLAECRAVGLRIEYELHAMQVLLPRSLFLLRPELFRRDRDGRLNPDANFCPSQPDAVGLVAENARQLAAKLRPDTGRYFFWGDDGGDWCHCWRCEGLTPADQALIVEHAILHALRRDDPTATVAHLAYHRTLAPPVKVTPETGIFLEYAPIHRRFDQPLADQPGEPGTDGLASLDANLAVFGTAGAQALEYWLDVSLASRWKKPAVALSWHPDICRTDIATYRARGLTHLTSFACFIDADYIATHGEPPLAEYGALLCE